MRIPVAADDERNVSALRDAGIVAVAPISLAPMSARRMSGHHDPSGDPATAGIARLEFGRKDQ